MAYNKMVSKTTQTKFQSECIKGEKNHKTNEKEVLGVQTNDPNDNKQVLNQQAENATSIYCLHLIKCKEN